MTQSQPPQLKAAWPSRLYIIRHGESEANVANAQALAVGAQELSVSGPDRNVPLSPRGVAQASALGAWLKTVDPPPATFLVSPYRRCIETASVAIASSGRAIPIQTDERLRERALGVLDRITPLGIRERFPNEAHERARVGKYAYRPPRGESWADVATRLLPFVDDLRARFAGVPVAIVTHQAVVLCLRYVIENLNVDELLAIDLLAEVVNCGVTSYRAEDDRLVLERYNDVQSVVTEAAKTDA